MNKPSERIVVFVTSAQKRAISATADELGISVSELMRRAVLAFNATSDQVKAASIVDRLNAPREPDVLAQALRKAARPLRHGRSHALLRAPGAAQAPSAALESSEAAQSGSFERTDDTMGPNEAAAEPVAGHAVDGVAPPFPVSPLAAEPDVARAAREIAQTVARLSAEAAERAAAADAAHAAEAADAAAAIPPEGANLPPSPLSSSPFAAAARPTPREGTDPQPTGPAPEDGQFA